MLEPRTNMSIISGMANMASPTTTSGMRASHARKRAAEKRGGGIRSHSLTYEPCGSLDMAMLMHDLRDMRDTLADIYDTDDYRASQQLAERLRSAGSDGVIYDSVRHEGGQCIAIFRPRRLRTCRATLHLTYLWDGERIARVYEKRELG